VAEESRENGILRGVEAWTDSLPQLSNDNKPSQARPEPRCSRLL